MIVASRVLDQRKYVNYSFTSQNGSILERLGNHISFADRGTYMPSLFSPTERAC